MIVVIIVCVDVVVDVDDQSDHAGYEAHVAEGVRATGDAVTLQVLTFLLFLLVLEHSLAGDVSSPEMSRV